jgi:hypothetical protein
VLAALARDRAAWDATARDAMCRQSALDAIENEGDAEAALTRFREIRGLYRQSDLVAWTVSNQVQAGDLERLLRDEQKLDRQTANWPERHLRRAMLDVLRLSGRYARLDRELEP